MSTNSLQNLTDGNYNLKKEFFKYTSLNIVGMIGFALYIFVDTFFIALALGPIGLAGLNFAIPAFSIMQGLLLMICIGSATLFSVYKSSINTREENSFTHGLILGLHVSFIFLLLGMFFHTEISLLLGAQDDALPITSTYIMFIFIFSPVYFINNMLLAFVRNDGNPKLPMIAIISSSLYNIIGDYILMFPCNLGILGAVISTVSASFISIPILLIHIYKKQNSFHIIKTKIYPRKFLDILKVGFSSFAGEMSTAISITTFNVLVFNISGNIGVAAYGVITNIAFVLNYLYTGLSQGIQPVTSLLYGEKKLKLVNRAILYSVIYATVIAGIFYAFLYFYTEFTVSIFNTQQDEFLQKTAESGILIFFIGYFFAGINYVSASILSSILKAKRGMTIAILRCSVVLVPMAIICSNLFGLTGLWLSFVLTEFIVVIISIVFLLQARQENLNFTQS